MEQKMILSECDTGNPEVEIKQEQKEVPEILDYRGFEENANVDQSEFHGISIKVEVKEETCLPDFQASEENVAVVPFRSDTGRWKENDCFPSDSTREVETRSSGLGIAKGRHFQYPKKANVSASDSSAERLHRNASGKRMGDEINETKLQNTNHSVAMASSQKPAAKARRELILVEEKRAIIKFYDEGMRIIDIAHKYGRPRSTVATIIQKRDKIMERPVARGATRITKQRSPVLERVEDLLVLWIRDRQKASHTVTEAIIREKARQLHGDLIAQQPGPSDEVFTASSGWFFRFKRRSKIHSVLRHGEAASCDVPAAEDFATTFYELIRTQGYVPQQVFNADETGLFWKRMARRIFITKEATTLPSHKQCKDRLTLLFCANASGDLKIKPLLVYSSLNPWAFKKHRVNKEDLGVFWRETRNAWVTRPIFIAWVNIVFGPAVRRYLENNNLPLKALLLLDNTPAHPPGLEQDLRPENRFIRIQFLPPNTTQILQPMDQQVISNFKKLYIRELFQRCVQITDCSRLTIQDFWKEHFDIMDCLDMIKRAWDGISQHNLNAAWCPLWPDSSQPAAQAKAAPSQEEDDDALVNEIVSLGRSIGLEITDDEVEELVDSHEDTELSTQELVELQQQEEELEDSSSGEEEEGAKKRIAYLPTMKLKAVLDAHEVYQSILAYHPRKDEAANFLAMDVTTFIPAVKAEIQKRQEQQPLERWFKRQRTDAEPSCSAAVSSSLSSSSS